MSKRDEYISKTKDALDQLNAELAKLEKRFDSSVEDLEGKRKEALANVREQRAKLESHLKELQDRGEHSWEELKDEVERVRKAFVHSFNYFKSQL